MERIPPKEYAIGTVLAIMLAIMLLAPLYYILFGGDAHETPKQSCICPPADSCTEKQ